MAHFSLLATFLDEVVDITIVTVALFLLLRVLRGSRARLAFVGVLIIGLVDLAARQFGLPLTAWFFQGLFLASVVVLLLAFQDDLKRFFERLAVWGLGRQPGPPGDVAIEAIVRASFALAAARRGALIVVPGREPLDRHLEGGFPLHGALSEPLLLSIFDPHSAGHDGAAVLEAGRVRRFGVHLPLSADFGQLGLRGTRHAAALGLAERCDALTVVVSEERGVVSIARAGRLRPVGGPDELRDRLMAFVDEARTRPGEARRSLGRMTARAGEWGIALGLALALWTLVVLGAEVAQATVQAPVQVTNLPAGYVLRSVSPTEVTVTVSGVRRRLFLIQPSDVTVRIDALLAQLGRRTFEVTPQSVHVPSGVTVTGVEPDHVSIDVKTAAADRKDAGTKPPEAGPVPSHPTAPGRQATAAP